MSIKTKHGDRITFRVKTPENSSSFTEHSGKVEAVTNGGVLIVQTDQGAMFPVVEQQAGQHWSLPEDDARKLGITIASLEEFVKKGQAAQAAVDTAIATAGAEAGDRDREPGSLDELQKLEGRAAAGAPLATDPTFNAGRLEGLRRRAAAGETITDPADAELLYKDEQYRAGMTDIVERPRPRNDKPTPPSVEDLRRAGENNFKKGKPNGGPRPLAIVYHGPAYSQAVDMLASIFGDRIRSIGHTSVDPANPGGDTLYLFQSDADPIELGKRILDSPHAHIFEPDLLEPTSEQIDQAAATAAGGELPYIA